MEREKYDMFIVDGNGEKVLHATLITKDVVIKILEVYDVVLYKIVLTRAILDGEEY